MIEALTEAPEGSLPDSPLYVFSADRGLAALTGAPEGSLPDGTLYTLTEHYPIGASALFYPGMMESLAEKFGGSYYVIPSSIRDVLILPDSDLEESQDAAGLGGIIREINKIQLLPNERLSDNAYHYDAGTGRFGKA